MVHDSRKPLLEVHREWKGYSDSCTGPCSLCPLAPKRQQSGGQFVFGEGRTGGIMFVGEGPGTTEEEHGRPFIGRSGQVLRKAITHLGLEEVSYITNIVACRSYGYKYDNAGQVSLRYDRKLGTKVPIVEDEKPPVQAVNACLGRLYEEIYIVDPILIVGLGAEAAKGLLRRPVAVTEKRGTTVHINVPGVMSTPELTDKGTWARKHQGRIIMPTSQNYVQYLMLITIHPAHVLRNHMDESHGNPVQVFMDDMHMAADIYYRMAHEAYGTQTAQRRMLTPEMLTEI